MPPIQHTLQDIYYWLTSHNPDNNTLIFAGGAALFVAVTAWLTGRWIKKRNTRHARYQRYANEKLKLLKGLDNPARQFGILRKTNAYVFEELILNAFEQAGYKIKRNKSYSGDGGIDGKVKIKGVWHLIQAKRYKNHIVMAHVKLFDEVCKTHKMQGLFIHTGRTGKGSREAAAKSRAVSIVSGQKLLDLLMKGKI